MKIASLKVFGLSVMFSACYLFAEGQNNPEVYSSITDPTLFAERITGDLQSVSHDVHLVVSFNPNRVRELRTPKKDNDEMSKLKLQEMRSNNFGFRKVEILPGNIGYLDLEYFADAGSAYAIPHVRDSGQLILSEGWQQD